MQKYTVLLLLMLALTLHAPPAQAATDSGLVAYWNFDGDVLDGKGTNNGTWSGSTTNRYVSGYRGMAGTFNGSDDYVDLGTGTIAAAVNGASATTLSLWFKADTLPGNDTDYTIFNAIISGTSLGIGVHLKDESGTDKIRIAGRSQNADSLQENKDNFSTTGSWVHLVAIYDYANDEIRYHLNGGSADTASVSFGSSTFVDANNQSTFDGISRSTNDFDGKIDEARIYNRALSAEEAYQLYSIGRITKAASPKTPAPKGGLIGHWTMDGTVADQAGSNNGTWYGSSTTRYDKDGAIKQCGTFNGSDDYVDCGTSSNLKFNYGQSFSVELWKYLVTGASSSGFIISKGAGVAVYNYKMTAANQFVISNGSSQVVINAGNVNYDTWQHLALVYDSSLSPNKMIAYVDGVEINRTTISAIGNDDNSVLLGKYYGGGSVYYFKGTIDSVRIYNRALTAAEIRQLANLPSPQSGLIGYWNFDGDVSDSSGNSNDGTWSGSTTNRYVSGYRGMAGTFASANSDYIEVPDAVSGNLGGVSAVTISAWIKRNAIGARHDILDLTISTTSSKIALNIQADNTIRLGGRADGADSFQNEVTTSTITDTNWHHVSGIMDIANDDIKIYVDGAEQTTSGTPSWTQTIFDADVGTRQVIGVSAGLSNGKFNGSIDETRIYNKALTAEEIYQLYSIGRVAKAASPKTPAPKGGLVGHWGLDGTVADQAGSNNGTWSGSSTTRYDNDGMIRQSGTFTAANTDYVGVNSPLNPSGIWSISFWFYAAGNYVTDADYCLFGLGVDSNMIYLNDNVAGLSVYDGGGGELLDADTSIGEWHHVGLVHHANGVVDGLIDGSSFTPTTGITFLTTTASWRFGTRTSGQKYFNGKIDDVRIYNRALTAAEIRQLANLPPPQSGLVGYWNFDGDASDSSGNSNDGTWSGSTTNRYVSGYRGMGGTFDGSSDYTGGVFSEPANISVAAWVYPTANSSNSGEGRIIQEYHARWSMLQGLAGDNGDQKLHAHIYDGSNHFTIDGDTLTLNQWTHAVLTYDGTDLKLYQNGVWKDETAVAQIGYVTDNKYRFGTHGDGLTNYYFTGKMDETRIYNRALTATEISDLYNYGRVKSGDM